MYCRNCGSEMAENAVVCVKCGVAKDAASNFCPNCGNTTNQEAVVCVNCGVGLKKTSSAGTVTGEKSGKTKMAAGLLAIFLGAVGAHEFYLGNQKKAVYKIIASVACAILSFMGIGLLGFVAVFGWNIYDAVMIFSGKRTDADGNELT